MTVQDEKEFFSSLEMERLLDMWERIKLPLRSTMAFKMRLRLIEEFKARNSLAFEAWMASGEDDTSLRRYMMKRRRAREN